MRELTEKAKAQKMEKEERGEGISIEARYWVGAAAPHFNFRTTCDLPEWRCP
jgi:hypothetical protein